ncbi:MAG: hypothetical protein K0S46_2420 [Moraxellaceae bacterium]|nr:hypothetical protein [Moraxellaceae bacterium]
MKTFTSAHVIKGLYIALALMPFSSLPAHANNDDPATACEHPVTRQYSQVSGTVHVSYEITTCEKTAAEAARKRSRFVTSGHSASATPVSSMQAYAGD